MDDELRRLDRLISELRHLRDTEPDLFKGLLHILNGHHQPGHPHHFPQPTSVEFIPENGSKT